MDAAYLKAAVPEPFTVLGKKLKPFCLGHELIFQRFGNKFSVESAESASLFDLLTSVHICSQPYSKDVSLDEFSIPFRVKLYARLFGQKYITRAANLFAAYIESHTRIPDFYIKGKPSAESIGTPTLQSVKVSLMANLGLSEMEALNTPFSLAFWNHLSWLEAQGTIQIIDDAERARIATAKANEARIVELGRRLFPCLA